MDKLPRTIKRLLSSFRGEAFFAAIKESEERHFFLRGAALLFTSANLEVNAGCLTRGGLLTGVQLQRERHTPSLSLGEFLVNKVLRKMVLNLDRGLDLTEAKIRAAFSITVGDILDEDIAKTRVVRPYLEFIEFIKFPKRFVGPGIIVLPDSVDRADQRKIRFERDDSLELMFSLAIAVDKIERIMGGQRRP